MKPEELTIGDIVTFKDCQNDKKPVIIKIWSINQDGEAFAFIDDDESLDEIVIDDEIVGIPITPGILEKNGFYFGHTSQQEDAASQIHCALPEPMWTWDEGAGSVQIVFPNESDGGEMYLSDQSFDRDLHFVFCENIYVHELQNVLKLCGIDKNLII